MFQKIIVAVDGSESSIRALDYAAHLASQDNAGLKIISTAEPLPYILGETESISPTYFPQYQEDLCKALKEIPKRQMERLFVSYPNLKVSAKVKDGRPVNVITEESKDADLIVIGHRGVGGILSWVLGSVAKQIVDSCTVPVLIVKDPEYC